MSEETTTAVDQGYSVMPWQAWQTQVLEPSVLNSFDMSIDSERIIAGAIREIAAAAFDAGHRYGFARRTNPNLE